MLSRREFLIGGLGGIAVASMTEARQATARRSRPVLSGALSWYDPVKSAERGLAGWRKELEQQSKIGFELLWLSNVSSAFATAKGVSVLADLLDLCAKHRFQVILDTGNTDHWFGTLDLKKELSVCSENIHKIGERFNKHPAFWAWYIPQEIYLWRGKSADYVNALYPALTERCKQAANLPVVVSPFFILDRDNVFGNFRYNEPDEYQQFWTQLIRRSGLDIVMMQDSGEHFSYVTNEMRRPFFVAMRGACRSAGARFWANVESAEFVCPSKEDYVKRYGRVHPSTVKNAPWRPVPIPRLKEKLELAAEYSEKFVTWGYDDFCRPALGKPAEKWYNDYLTYFKSAKRA